MMVYRTGGQHAAERTGQVLPQGPSAARIMSVFPDDQAMQRRFAESLLANRVTDRLRRAADSSDEADQWHHCKRF